MVQHQYHVAAPELIGSGSSGLVDSSLFDGVRVASFRDGTQTRRGTWAAGSSYCSTCVTGCSTCVTGCSTCVTGCSTCVTGCGTCGTGCGTCGTCVTGCGTCI